MSLTVYQIAPSLPPAGVGGSVLAEDIASGPTRESLMDPSRHVLDVEDWPDTWRGARVHATDHEWDGLGELFLERGVCCTIAVQDIPRDAQGKRILVGAMGVAKPKSLPDGRPICRLVVNAIPSNFV